MKKTIPLYVFLLLMTLFGAFNSYAQCPTTPIAYTRDTLDWDFMEFFPNTGTYVSPTPYLTLAQSQTQYFTFGTNKVTATHNFSGANAAGVNVTNTAETGAYGVGADVQFKGNGAITFTFASAVRNVKFSVFDIDRSQRITITAMNGIVPTVVTTLARLNNNILTITGSGGLSPYATASNLSATNSSVDGTVNVDISGPITSFTITASATGTCSSGCSGTGGSEDGSWWVSDVAACYFGATFPNNYYNISRPFTNQPSYVLASRNDSVYYVNVANGVARFLFADYGNDYLNSMAYDPYRHMVYYTYSLSGPGGVVSSTDYVLRRYDYDMDTLGVVSTDVRTLGIPLFDQSVESGGAAFYDGSLYLGIEGGVSVSDRKSIIWKLDFNSTTWAPVGPATQMFGIESDTHDWADFGINNGVLYDFDGRSGSEEFWHKNMATGGTIRYNNSPSTLIPRQTGVDWNGLLYNIGSPSVIAAGTIVPYNNNGTVGATPFNITFNNTTPTGSWGDAAEAFKPKTDFGDAPASYDPAGIDPGTHERNDSLYLGPLKPGIEWTKKTSANASGDGAEEDGVAGLQVITTGVSNFLVPVRVYNNTGRTATLVAWVDANGNGLFSAAEGRTVAVASNPAVQTINVLWSGINCTLPANSTTFMRLRLATNDQGLTTSTPNGYVDNGEIEDFPVSVSLVLPTQSISLKAQKANKTDVNLQWDINDENGIHQYELQSSNDAVNWNLVSTHITQGNIQAASYTFVDTHCPMPKAYFRIKATKNSGAFFYSEIKTVEFNGESSLSINPNPVADVAHLKLQSTVSAAGIINVLDYTGRIVYQETVKVAKGQNNFNLPIVQKLSSGIYKVRVQVAEEVLVSTLVIIKK